MRVLAFDTSTGATTAAIRDAGAGLELELRDDPPLGARPRHAAKLLPLIHEAMTRTGTSWDQVERIAVGVGPGTFTGLRIGVATARALAGARGIKISPISSLESLALAASGDTVLAAIDARRGEAFAAAWCSAAEVAPAKALNPDDLARLAQSVGPGALAVGTGAILFRSQLEAAGATVPSGEDPRHRVSALTHCALALNAPERDPREILPAYLRLPDAELNRR
jgi:tRNA threonylcarbamoyladenosine biosynthesis protein TsaB